MGQYLRLAFRQLRRNPGFAAAVVVTLALGIGANTAIFSVCNAVLLEPLPYPDSDRLVMLWDQVPQSGSAAPVAPANFRDWQAQSRSFTEVAAINPFPTFVVTGE